MDLFCAALIIFCLRLADQSLGTMRSRLVSRDKPIYAALIGLIESAIWIIAVAKVINDIDEPILIAGYAIGFAAGTILGYYAERILGLGDVVIRVFVSIKSPSVAEPLREKGFGVTVINGEGKDGTVKISWCIIPRRKLKSALQIIKKVNPQEVLYVIDGMTGQDAVRSTKLFSEKFNLEFLKKIELIKSFSFSTTGSLYSPIIDVKFHTSDQNFFLLFMLHL